MLSCWASGEAPHLRKGNVMEYFIIGLLALLLVVLGREFYVVCGEFDGVCADIVAERSARHSVDCQLTEAYDVIVILDDEAARLREDLDVERALNDVYRSVVVDLRDEIEYLKSLVEADVVIAVSGSRGRGTLRALSDDDEISLMNRQWYRKANSKYRNKK